MDITAAEFHDLVDDDAGAAIKSLNDLVVTEDLTVGGTDYESTVETVQFLEGVTIQGDVTLTGCALQVLEDRVLESDDVALVAEYGYGVYVRQGTEINVAGTVDVESAVYSYPAAALWDDLQDGTVSDRDRERLQSDATILLTDIDPNDTGATTALLETLAQSGVSSILIPADLDLEGTDITALPDNLGVDGSLRLNETDITALPDNLGVDGNLYLNETDITTLPDDLEVDGSLHLEGTNITALPDDLEVGGGLDLGGTNITELSDGLKVDKYLDLRDTPIMALPDDLEVGHDLVLRKTDITTLPDDLEVGGDLYLEGATITEIPERIKDQVGGGVNLDPGQEFVEESKPESTAEESTGMGM